MSIFFIFITFDFTHLMAACKAVVGIMLSWHIVPLEFLLNLYFFCSWKFILFMDLWDHFQEIDYLILKKQELCLLKELMELWRKNFMMKWKKLSRNLYLSKWVLLIFLYGDLQGRRHKLNLDSIAVRSFCPSCFIYLNLLQYLVSLFLIVYMKCDRSSAESKVHLNWSALVSFLSCKQDFMCWLWYWFELEDNFLGWNWPEEHVFRVVQFLFWPKISCFNKID